MKVRSIVVELIDICNLNCAYCLRDEESLHGRAHALPIADLERILGEAKALGGRCAVQFTGGEPTLHPEFRKALKAVSDLGWRYTVITNGWTFPRSLPAFLEFRDSLNLIAFSIDGVTQAGHDAVRGKGSFRRLMRGVLACRQQGLPFCFKVTMDRRKGALLRSFVEFAVRLGASRMEIGPLLPANPSSIRDTMDIAEQHRFLSEVEQLRTALKMPIDLAAGFFAPRPEPSCGPLLGQTINIDYHARLVLCTVLAGFRGQKAEPDVIADLRQVPLAHALTILLRTVEDQNRRRIAAFAELGGAYADAPLELGSPCMDCLCSFGKMRPGLFDWAKEEKIPMDDTLLFDVPDAVIASDFDGHEGLLLDTGTQRYYKLNETATFLWAEIDKGRTVAAMIASLCGEYDVEERKARESVVAALSRLESQGLIQRRSLGPSQPMTTTGASRQ